MTDWHARVTNDPMDFVRGQVRIVMWRRLGERVDQVTGFTPDGTAEITTIDEGTIPDFRGFALPDELVEAIGEAIKPGPSTGELRRLEEALDVERHRVDRIITTRTEEPT